MIRPVIGRPEQSEAPVPASGGLPHVGVRQGTGDSKSPRVRQGTGRVRQGTGDSRSPQLATRPLPGRLLETCPPVRSLSPIFFPIFFPQFSPQFSVLPNFRLPDLKSKGLTTLSVPNQRGLTPLPRGAPCLMGLRLNRHCCLTCLPNRHNVLYFEQTKA